MKKNKLTYVAPEAEIFALKPAGILCQSPAHVWHYGGADYYDENNGDINSNGDY